MARQLGLQPGARTVSIGHSTKPYAEPSVQPAQLVALRDSLKLQRHLTSLFAPSLTHSPASPHHTLKAGFFTTPQPWRVHISPDRDQCSVIILCRCPSWQVRGCHRLGGSAMPMHKSRNYFDGTTIMVQRCSAKQIEPSVWNAPF